MNNKTESKKTNNSDLEECLAILPMLLDFNELEANTQAEIIDEIKIAYHNGLTDVKLASNLYWKFHSITEGDRVVKGLKNKKIYGTAFKDDTDTLKIKLDEPLKSTNETIIELRGGYNKIVDPSLRLNWNFIATNSLQYIHNNMQLLAYEEDAINCEIYFVFHAGSPCEWCETHTGKIVRLLPRKMIDNSIDELSHYNIKDPHTETAIWFNKNNIGLSQYRLCAFPHVEEDYTCNFELQPINAETEIFTKRKEQVEKLKNNIYEAVSSEEYANKIKEREKDASLPIPVSIDSPDFKIIFGETAEEFREPTLVETDIIRYKYSIYKIIDEKEFDNKIIEWLKERSQPIPISKKSIEYHILFKNAEIESKQPTFIGNEIVRYNNTIYKSFSENRFEEEKNKWSKNTSLPIPVLIDSDDYKQIFIKALNRRVGEKRVKISGGNSNIYLSHRDHTATEIEKELRKPTLIGENLVRFNNNIYEAVDKKDYNKKLEEWRKDRSRPIPVSRSSTDYKQIIEAAEKREEQKKSF